MTSDIPVPTEKDYLANYIRAAVDSAYTAGWRAGYGQGRDDEAAGEECP